MVMDIVLIEPGIFGAPNDLKVGSQDSGQVAESQHSDCVNTQCLIQCIHWQVVPTIPVPTTITPNDGPTHLVPTKNTVFVRSGGDAYIDSSYLPKPSNQRITKMMVEITNGAFQLRNLWTGISSISLADLSDPMSTGVKLQLLMMLLTTSLALLSLPATKT